MFKPKRKVKKISLSRIVLSIEKINILIKYAEGFRQKICLNTKHENTN